MNCPISQLLRRLHQYWTSSDVMLLLMEVWGLQRNHTWVLWQFIIQICVLKWLIHAAEYHSPQVVITGKLTPVFFQHCPCISIRKTVTNICMLFICALCTHCHSWHKNFPWIWLLNTNYLSAIESIQWTGKSTVSAGVGTLSGMGS